MHSIKKNGRVENWKRKTKSIESFFFFTEIWIEAGGLDKVVIDQGFLDEIGNFLLHYTQTAVWRID
jgi:hypothetical protein